MEEKKISVFLAGFDHQVSEIEKIYTIIDDKYTALSRERVSSETVESSGYWLHNLYCAYEDLFKMVSAFWEYRIEIGGAFHRNLIRRMILEIKGIRPARVSDKSFRHLDELRGFRHVFRHAYSYGMDDERILHLARKVREKKDYILKEINQFRQRVSIMLEP